MAASDPGTVIFIASSTGGTKVLRFLFQNLPRLNASIVIVQHMQKTVNEFFSSALGSLTDMTVRIAESGAGLEAGTAYVAPSDVHLVLKGSKIELVKGKRVNYVCPSADVTMQSLVPWPGLRVLGIVLTGIGHDGEHGIVHLKQNGATTIAQDPATCVVRYMPKNAIETGQVDHVIRPNQIREAIIRFAGTLPNAPIMTKRWLPNR